MRTTLCQIIHRNLNKSKTTGDVRINSKILITGDSNISILSPRHRKKNVEKKWYMEHLNNILNNVDYRQGTE